MIRYLFLLSLISFLTTMCTKVETNDWEDGRWVDLTYEYSDETLYWPTSSTFKMDTVFVGITDGGFYYESFAFSSAEHGGTHLDAPIHFFPERDTVEELEIDRLTGRAVVINVTDKVALNRDYQFEIDDLLNWETENGSIPNGSILLFHTGMGQYWPDAEAYLGTELKGEDGVSNLSFPGIHPDTATWIVENRNVSAIGVDTPSLDYGQSVLFEAHQILFEHNIPGFENVANLDQLPPYGAYIIALPMKIKDGSGAPLRIVAHIRD